MKYFLIPIFFALPYLASGQSGRNPVQEKESQSAEISSSSRKIQSAGLQQQANNFFNSYISTEKNKSLSVAEKNIALSKISKDAAQQVAGTWQYALIQFLQSNKRNKSSLDFALKFGNNTVVLPYAIQYAIIQNNTTDLATYTAQYDKLTTIESNAFVYHYNTLMSADSNATIYARGLLDLVQLAVLQQQHNVRKDIHLKYYEDDIAEKENAYLCLSIGKEVLQRYPLASFTGLLIKINGGNSIAELEKHIFSDFDLGNFKHEYQGFSTAVPNKNYLPGFLLLYRYYLQKQKDTTRVEKMIDKIRAFYGITEPLY